MFPYVQNTDHSECIGLSLQLEHWRPITLSRVQDPAHLCTVQHSSSAEFSRGPPVSTNTT
jgi:hypothetical protein